MVCTLGHGRGGHFYDVRVTAEALMQVASCAICEIGFARSPVLQQSTAPVHFVDLSQGVFRAWRELREVVRRSRPTVLHAFDLRAYAFARVASVVGRIPIVLTKCGGPNPSGWFPAASSLIVYSAENRDYFQSKWQASRHRVYLIPNRASRVRTSREREEELRRAALLSPARATFVRISRFVEPYRESIVQSIALVDRLNRDGLPAQLVVIGVPEDGAVFRSVAEHQGDHVRLITDERFTVNASELLGVADVVVGTGRGVMEAASLGIPVLVPGGGRRYPIPLTPENFESLFRDNFSPRCSDPSLGDEAAYRIVRGWLTDRRRMEEASRFVRSVYERHFDIAAALPAIMQVYEAAQVESLRRPGDLLRSVASAARTVLGGRRARVAA